MKQKKNTNFKIKIIKSRISKYCFCPTCRIKQPFKKKNEHWKILKDFDLEKPILLKVQVLEAKCLNSHCNTKSFSLPIKGITKYQKAANRIIKEAIVSNIIDNDPCQKIKDRFSRSLNTTGSRATIDRWKQREAEVYSFKEIIKKLSPSPILCLDDLGPKRSKESALILSDRMKGCILYIDTVNHEDENEVVRYLHKIKELGIHTVDCFIVDMWKSFPAAIRKVYPNAKIQYDYFHIWQDINRHLESAIKEYCNTLRKEGLEKLASDLWKKRKLLLTNPHNHKKMTQERKEKIKELQEIHPYTVVNDVLMLKERIRDIFDHSCTQQEAYGKKNQLYSENWHEKSLYFKKIIKLFMLSPYCYHIFTYLKEPNVPRSGNSENSIKTVRSWEKPRYGFRIIKGLQNHLKLYQRIKYLGEFLD